MVVLNPLITCEYVLGIRYICVYVLGPWLAFGSRNICNVRFLECHCGNIIL